MTALTAPARPDLTALAQPGLVALARLTEDPAAFRDDAPDHPVVFRTGGGFDDLFDWDALDAVLATGARRRPDFRVLRDSAQLPESRYVRSTVMHPDVPDVRKISRELADGATLVLQGLHEYVEPLARFTRALAHDLSRPVHGNAYITPPKSQGFKAHFDPRDSFVLQVSGTKVWTLRPPVLEQPHAHESWELLQRRPGWEVARLEALTPWLEVTLEPGDSLWLPRGWVHSARSEGVTSMHLTLSFTAWTEHWAVKELMSRIVEAPGRRSLPVDFIRDPEVARNAVAELRTGLAQWLDGLSDATLAGFLQAAAVREFAVPLRQASAVLVDDVTEDTEFAVHREAVLAAVEQDDQVVLRLADRSVVVPRASAHQLPGLLARDRFTVAELNEQATDEARPDVLRLVRLLHTEGLVSPVRP